MPVLVLVRHADAEPTRPDDQARALTAKGRDQCAELREWLEAQGVEPDWVVVSTALRAQQTWELAGVGDVAPVADERVYGAGVPGLREVVKETSQDVATLVVVGHNPTCEQLAWALDDSERARELTDRGMRTAGAGVFLLDGWDADAGELLAWR